MAPSAAPEKAPARMPTRVMPIWTVERNRPGSSASLRAVLAPARPVSAIVFRRALRADTMASSDRANSPFSRIRRMAMPSSNTGHSGARGATPRLSMLQWWGFGRDASSDEHPQLVEEGADAGDDRRGYRDQDQDAADGGEPADDGGQAVPLQNAEGKRRQRNRGRNVAERDRQEQDDRQEQTGRADDPLRDRVEQHAH